MEDVTGFLIKFMMVSEAMVEETTPPFTWVICRNIFFPVTNYFFNSKIPRKRHNGVQMVGHQETETTAPNLLFIIKFYGREKGVANSREA